jgi:cysteine dioxygenase
MFLGAVEEEVASGGGRRSSFPARRQSRRDSWNWGQYEDPLSDKIIGFDELKSTLDQTFDATEGINSLDIVRTALFDVMSRFRTIDGELERMALFDYTKPYTRNCVASTDKYTLLLLCWNPAAQSRIHDHPCDACILTVLEGHLKEERYAPGSDIVGTAPKPTATKFYLETQTSYMTDDVGLHKIYNPNATLPAISLHLYYPPFQVCTVWPEAPDGTVKKGEQVKIGTFSFRGIRTPQSEGRMSSHGQVMQELQRTRPLMM